MTETQGSLDIVVRVLEEVLALRKQEVALQAQRYAFADRERIRNAYTQLLEENREALRGTPEALYLSHLISSGSVLDRLIESYIGKGLSLRTGHALINAGVERIGDLVDKPEYRVKRIKNIGKTGIQEIEKFIFGPLGLSYNMDVGYKRPEER